MEKEGRGSYSWEIWDESRGEGGIKNGSVVLLEHSPPSTPVAAPSQAPTAVVVASGRRSTSATALSS